MTMTDNTIPHTSTSQDTESAPVTVNIELLGKSYQIKCKEYETHALQKAAEHLNNTMKTMPSNSKLVTPEKLGIMAALNLASQMLEMEHQMSQQLHFLNQRLSSLQNKLENALAPATDPHAPFRLEIESVQA